MICIRNLTPEAAMNDGMDTMASTDVDAIFWQAVNAWERGELEAFRTDRSLLFHAFMGGPESGKARELHLLLADYVCCVPSRVVPFAAYAMGRACKALKGLNVATHRDTVRNGINSAHHVGHMLLQHGERSAAIDSTIRLAGMRDALEGLDNTLYTVALDAHTDLLDQITQHPTEPVSTTFQSPISEPAPIPSLEGLFTTLCQRLDQLTQVRTDLPGDYMARCKANFTDALLTELERQHYHSEAFDRLITLRDAWDSGRLESPHVMENTP
ncbi:hypothetical protein [Marinobacter sp. V034]|uniref:hypothetical protein n=1 Tax=Marinobacter sp. V034 TaxID=3459610 RepID=UPI004043E64A